MISVVKVYGFSCPNKYVLMNGSNPILVVNGLQRASKCMAYLSGYTDNADMDGDKKALGILDKIKNDNKL